MKKEKQKINNISIIKNCYGCGVCVSACPHNIISLKESKKGFYKPVIDYPDKCTSCGLCLKSCSYVNDCKSITPQGSYASWSTDQNIRYQSSSGGVAYEFARHALSSGYLVCGVIYNTENNRAEHVIIDNEDDLSKTLGSKYIPSYTTKAFKDLFLPHNRGQKFAIFGTPCQIASLRLTIKKYKRENDFLLIDFFCHGVPSLLAWDKYIQEKNLSSKSIDSISWRDKKFGWHDSWYITGKSKDHNEVYRSQNVSKDEFFQFFLSHHALAQCCLEACKFKKLNSMADIRVGDLWGEKYNTNQEGVSGVLAFTPIGNQFINSMKSIILQPESTDIVTAGQMDKNATKPKGYNLSMFLLQNFKSLSLKGILDIVNNANRLKNLPSRILNKLRNK